ncbi:flagellin [Burkholderia oklahomensis]|uniref:flagellin N-terminal helical domain-containing protein n=1 Tax=Burkholderia oklahomensis TaxID=342113 RepID=UPI00264FB487|nr:flagellin [Burkholderia oklahomensis]MDN7675513.1 flagellin [Burkholderia oklahomensis]
MLSLHTNIASLRIQGALANSQASLTTSMTRLGTGYRINSAADGAADLQIATRLRAQHSGMEVARDKNASNAKSMLQTAEGAFAEVENIVQRMKDLATQAADSSYTQPDRDAMQKEYDALGNELINIIGNTSYGGEKLFAKEVAEQKPEGENPGTPGKPGGKLTKEMKFQIGNTSDEVMTLDVSKALEAVTKAFGDISAVFKAGASGVSGGGKDIAATQDANAMLEKLTAALDSVGGIRAEIGAGQNRLDHVRANLTNMSSNTKDAEGSIRDVDYASEAANQARLTILQQAGGSMLKQASQMSQLVLSLLQ